VARGWGHDFTYVICRRKNLTLNTDCPENHNTFVLLRCLGWGDSFEETFPCFLKFSLNATFYSTSGVAAWSVVTVAII
jgi:hypothetical protein